MGQIDADVMAWPSTTACAFVLLLLFLVALVVVVRPRRVLRVDFRVAASRLDGTAVEIDLFAVGEFAARRPLAGFDLGARVRETHATRPRRRLPVGGARLGVRPDDAPAERVRRQLR
jgi:hypothetical protein